VKSINKFIWVFLFLGFFTSCRKGEASYKNDEVEIKAQVIEWLNKKWVSASDSDKIVIETLKANIQWEGIYGAMNSKGDQKFLFGVNDFFTANRAAVNSYTALFMSINNKGEIGQGNILSLYSTSEVLHTERKKLLVNLLDNKVPNNFNGVLTKSTIANRFIFELGFKNGKLYSKKNFQKKLKRELGSGRSQQLRCYDVYLVVTYQYPDGTIGQEWEYLYTNCVDEPDCLRIQIINGRSYRTGCGGGDPGGGGGSGSGGGSNPDTTIYNICRQVDSLEVNSAFKQRMTALFNAVSLNYEVGYIMQRNNNGTYNYALIQGSSNGGGLPDFNFTQPQDGILHTHYAGLLSIFSPDDLRSLFRIYRDNYANSGFIYGLVTGSTTYLLEVGDLQTFLQFGQQYLEDATSFELFKNIYSNVYVINNSNSPSLNEQRFLWLLNEVNSGLKMFSEDVTTFNNWDLKGLNLNNEVILLNCN
jgi:hypothetical protein